jgi:hypothetical protein
MERQISTICRAKSFQHLESARTQAFAIEPPETGRFDSHHDVFCHRKMRTQGEFLVDERNAVKPPVEGGDWNVRPARDFHLAPVSSQRTSQYIHQRGFTGAVLSD